MRALVVKGGETRKGEAMKTIKTYERVLLNDYDDSHGLPCPECGSFLCWVGTHPELKQGILINHKMFQCRGCLKLFKEVGDTPHAACREEEKCRS